MPNSLQNLFGYGAPQQARDDAVGRSQEFFSQNLLGRGASGGSASRNPDPFGAGLLPATAYQSRQFGKRAIAPVLGALSAQNYLLDPQLELARRGGRGAADLYGDIAPRYLEAFRGADSDTSGLMELLAADARGLIGRGNNPYEDQETVQSIRGAQSARGMGFGNSDALMELLGLDRERDSRRIQRGNYGAGIAQVNQGYTSPLLLSLLGQYGNPAEMVGTDDLLSIGLREQQSRREATAARKAGQNALAAAGIQAVGAIAGAAVSPGP